MSKQELWAHFHIPDIVSILLENVEPLTSKKLSHNATYFSKELFNVGLRFHLPFLFEQFLYFTKIPLAFLLPNVVRVLMGCSILDMLYRLDLYLLKVFFVYTIKMSQK